MTELSEKERKIFHDFHSKLASIDAAVKMIKRSLLSKKGAEISNYTSSIDQAFSDLLSKWEEIKSCLPD